MAFSNSYDRRSFYILFLAVNCFLALSSQNVVAARYYSADGITNSEKAATLLTNDIAGSLQKVTELLQRASDEVHTDRSNAHCGRNINHALSFTLWAQSHLLHYRYREAIQTLDRINSTLSNCSEAHVPPSVGVSELILDLTHQASNLVEGGYVLLADPESEILDTRKLHRPVPIERKGTNDAVDGTKCQFSSFGKGKALPNCAIGFAGGVTGGAGGQSYTVTSSEDTPHNPGEGTLRHAVKLAASSKTKGAWITFARDMVINLQSKLWIPSHTTIDGRGVNVTITSRGLALAGVQNVILHNFQINGVHDSDTVHIYAGTSKVWVDHLTSFDGKLGLVSVVQGSTDVTISNSLLSNHNFNMLLGASDTDVVDRGLRVTVYRNWFKDSFQRMPHCRWGHCHVVNNLYSNWGYYAIGARVHAKVYSEKNVFHPARKHEVTPYNDAPGFDTTPIIVSSHDLLLNGSTFHQFLRYGILNAPEYGESVYYPPLISPQTLTQFVENCSGALFGSRLRKCMQSN